jgi:DNA mismatch repair ATPase MutL
MNNTILSVKGLKKYFPVTAGIFRKEIGKIKAVDDINFDVKNGHTLGIVGESGSGKSTAARTAIRLIEPTEGEIFFLNQNLRTLSIKELNASRKHVQMVFQNPYSSLNPRFTIGESIGEGILYHGMVKNKNEQREYVEEILKQVGLSPESMDRFPHQFSGGQQQRICIGILKGYIMIDQFPGRAFSGICLVDQKAAHSRILFEKLQKEKSKSQNQPIQHFLVPYSFQTTSLEEKILHAHLEGLNQFGISIQSSGPNAFFLNGLADFYGKIDGESFILELISNLKETSTGDLAYFHQMQIQAIANAASKQAISRKICLNYHEAEQLLKNLMQCKTPFLCPSGKPTMIHITEEEIAKRFQ